MSGRTAVAAMADCLSWHLHAQHSVTSDGNRAGPRHDRAARLRCVRAVPVPVVPGPAGDRNYAGRDRDVGVDGGTPKESNRMRFPVLGPVGPVKRGELAHGGGGAPTDRARRVPVAVVTVDSGAGHLHQGVHFWERAVRARLRSACIRSASSYETGRRAIPSGGRRPSSSRLWETSASSCVTRSGRQGGRRITASFPSSGRGPERYSTSRRSNCTRSPSRSTGC